MRVLYHIPLSPYARKVRLVLAEKRLPYELRLEKMWERRAEYLELNPACTVPTLVEDNGLVIPDFSVICEYLEEAYPDSILMGRTLAERIEVRRLAAWFDGKFAAEVTNESVRRKISPAPDRRGNPDPATIRMGFTALRYHLDYIAWLAETRKWLAGAQPVSRRLRRRGASLDTGFPGRGGLDHLAGGQGLVCAHEVAAEFPRGAGG